MIKSKPTAAGSTSYRTGITKSRANSKSLSLAEIYYQSPSRLTYKPTKRSYLGVVEGPIAKASKFGAVNPNQTKLFLPF